MPASRITYKEGNLFEEIYNDVVSPVIVIPHIVNNVGMWGGGFTHHLSKWCGEPEFAYATTIKANEDKDPATLLGKCQLVPCEAGLMVANLYAQDNSRMLAPAPKGVRMSKVLDLKELSAPLVDYGAVARSLDALGTALDLPNTLYSIHMPPIGVGIGGGEWVKIKEILEAFCTKFDTTITVDCIDHKLFEEISNA